MPQPVWLQSFSPAEKTDIRDDKNGKRQEADAEDDPERDRMVFKRYGHVHGKSAHDEGGHHDADGDDVQGFHEYAEIVVHDRCAGVHEARQDVRVNFRLPVALVVLYMYVVQVFPAFLGEPQPRGIELQFVENHGVGIDGVEVIHQAFLQGEHVGEVLVLHGDVDFLLQRIGNHIDHFQVAEEMRYDAENDLEHHVVQGLDLVEELAFQDPHVVRHHDDQLVHINEHSHG